MTEHVIKKRVLTKVRTQFLHKRPPDDDEVVAENTYIIATPEQLNGPAAMLLESSVGLTEKNRKVYAGYQFLNLNYKIGSNVKIENPSKSQTVTLDIQSNSVDILPWEYCVERLESYGDLELATWANRIKTYHKNYSEMMAKYFHFINSTDPRMMEMIAKGKEAAKLGSRDLESRYAYRKAVFYGDRDGLRPFSLTFHEGLLKHLGHSVDGFVKWTGKHGIPGIFRKDCNILLEQCKRHLTSSGGQQSFFQEGPEYVMDVCDKKGEKKPTRMKMYIAMVPAPQGCFLTIYSILKDYEPDDLTSETGEGNDKLYDRKFIKSEENGSKCEEITVSEPDSLKNKNETE